MPRRRVRASVLPILASLVGAVTLLVPSPAGAAVWRYHDETADHRRFGDLDTVRVDARERRVHLRVVVNGSLPEELAIFLDTDPDQHGPEFAARWTGGNRVEVRRVDGWVAARGRLRCSPASVTVRGDVWVAGFSVGCLALGDRPSGLRVNVESNYETAGQTYDHAPAAHRFGRWFVVG